MSMEKLHAAYIAMPGHKSLFGPQGTGLLLCAHTAKPLLYGGTGSLSKSPDMPEFLPDRLEAGTQNMHGIAGLLEGLRYVMQKTETSIAAHEASLMRYLKTAIHQDRVHLYAADRNDCQLGVLSITPKEGNCETLGQLLSDHDFAVRTGFHCAPIAHKIAGTYNTGTVRISLSALTPKEDVEEFVHFVNNMNLS